MGLESTFTNLDNSKFVRRRVSHISDTYQEGLRMMHRHVFLSRESKNVTIFTIRIKNLFLREIRFCLCLARVQSEKQYVLLQLTTNRNALSSFMNTNRSDFGLF